MAPYTNNQEQLSLLQLAILGFKALPQAVSTYWPYLLAIFAAVNLVYGCVLVVYRLYFSPLAKFPGPKLAAATQYVEIWYDVFRGGKFTLQIAKWHEQYGRIIRISPFEIHIDDAEFHELLYANDTKYIKIEEMKNRIGIAQSTFETVGHEHHRIRRGAISSFFSRQSILKFSDFIQERVDRICLRLQTEWKDTGKPVNVNDMWATLTADVITYFSFAWDNQFAEYPDFVAPFTRAIWHQARSVHAMGHFPALLKGLEMLPRSILLMLSPTMGPVFDFHNATGDQVEAIKNGQNTEVGFAKHRTVFHEIFDSNLPPEEKTIPRLRQEASAITGAGIDTSKTALSNATFYILNNPEIYKKLYAELVEAIPDENRIPSLPKLEALPYLDACINEALRLSYGVAQRHSRISPDRDIEYDGWVIPAGARFGMSSYMTHRDPRIFPDPDKFDPERFLNNNKSFSGRSLERYIFTFGRGPRVCLGINLAKAEIYIGLATLFRRVHLKLFETTLRDVSTDSEFLVAMPPIDSQGVRCLVE